MDDQHHTLCISTLKHQRFTPATHAFDVSLWMHHCHLSRLENSPQKAPWGFRRRDYTGDPNTPLSQCIRNLVKPIVGQNAIGSIRMLSVFSSLGYHFNPLTVYFVMDSGDDNVMALVLEVTNTPWGEKTCYTFKPKQTAQQQYQAEFQKTMHVSPFMTMDYIYHLNCFYGQDEIHLSLSNYRDNAVHFAAHLHCQQIPFSNRAWQQLRWKRGLMPQRITSQIYWQAWRLWRKGVPFIHHPKEKQQHATNS
jgi:DUF1365 family protein